MKSEIPLRALNEYSYCKRLYYLMYVEKFFADNKDTTEGRLQHDTAISKKPIVIDNIEGMDEEEITSFMKDLYLGEEASGLSGKIDALFIANGCVIPVEKKHSASPGKVFSAKLGKYDIESAAWTNDFAQIAGQLYLLNVNGFNSPFGYIYYRQNKKYIKIPYDDKIAHGVLELTKEISNLNERPLPLVSSDKCFRCSLNEICLPEETNYFLGKNTAPAKIIAGRKDAGILYIATPPKTVSLKTGRIVISELKQTIDSIPIKDILSVTLFGAIQITTQALHQLLKNNISVSFLSAGGLFIGNASSQISQNVHLRKRQFIEFDTELGFSLSKSLIEAKILNQRTLLRRNSKTPLKTLDSLKSIAHSVNEVEGKNSLLGVEGAAARLYFENFHSMLKDDKSFDFNGRNKRPPKDPVNALLSLAYALLLNDMLIAVQTVGFDPMYGFYHTDKPGRPALSLDLMESYRPIIADSVVIRAINTKAISIEDFHISRAGCILSDKGRKKFIELYENRMDELVTYPKFNYRMCYRRILEVEVRMFAKFIEKEISDWKPLTTR